MEPPILCPSEKQEKAQCLQGLVEVGMLTWSCFVNL